MVSMNTVPYERSIASTLMYDVSKTGVLIGVLKADHFFDDLCREIFVLAQDAYLRKDGFSDLAVMAKIPNKEDELLAIASEQPVSSETLLMQADMLIKAYGNRQLLKKLEKAKTDLLEGREVSLDDLKSDDTTRTNFRENADIIDRMEAMLKNPTNDHGTGLKELDYFLNLEPGNLIILAARPSMGKTAAIISIMLYLLEKGEGSLFFSLEMAAEAIMMRAISNKSGETLSDIRHGKLIDYNRYKDARDYLKKAKNFIVFDQSVDHIQIYNIAMAAIRKNPSIKNIFIDHLTYVRDPGGYANTHLRIGDVTKTMKRLAKDAGVKVWVLSQLSRAIESRPNKRPQLSDMRESGSIEEDADVIIGLYRESYYTSREEATKEAPVNEVEMIVMKNRDGEVGGAKTYFHGPTVKFADDPPGYGLAEVVEYTDDSMPTIDMPMV